MKIFLVAGARPNFMKIAPLIHELNKQSGSMEWKVVHTGQHYDYEMSKAFFDDFDLPEPDYFLNVGSGTHAEQTSKIMVEFEKVYYREKPGIVVVVGDVNSTLACSITAKKLGVKVAHVEAGLRSGDMTMPEEINRIVTDAISDYLFVTEKSGIANLTREGRKSEQVFFVGNIMIDTLYYGLEKLKRLAASPRKLPLGFPYAVVTLHRPTNVDEKQKLQGILESLAEISRDLPLYFPVHPRTKKNIEKFMLGKLIQNAAIRLMAPMPYLEFLSLWKDAALVLTDSGGIQEETTAMGVPCFTIRENTERPITIEEGTNTLVGTSYEGILSAFDHFKKNGSKKGRVPALWDGKASKRIVDILLCGFRKV